MAIKVDQSLIFKGDKFCKYYKKNNHFITEYCKLNSKEKITDSYREKGKPNDEGNAFVSASKADNWNGDFFVVFARCANSADE